MPVQVDRARLAPPMDQQVAGFFLSPWCCRILGFPHPVIGTPNRRTSGALFSGQSHLNIPISTILASVIPLFPFNRQKAEVADLGPFFPAGSPQTAAQRSLSTRRVRNHRHPARPISAARRRRCTDPLSGGNESGDVPPGAPFLKPAPPPLVRRRPDGENPLSPRWIVQPVSRAYTRPRRHSDRAPLPAILRVVRPPSILCAQYVAHGGSRNGRGSRRISYRRPFPLRLRNRGRRLAGYCYARIAGSGGALFLVGTSRYLNAPGSPAYHYRGSPPQAAA